MAGDRGNPAQRLVQHQRARVLDGREIVARRINMMAHLRQAVALAGNGTDTASFRIPIRATTALRTQTHALKLALAQNYGAGLPLRVNVAPLPVLAAAPVAGPLHHPRAGRISGFPAAGNGGDAGQLQPLVGSARELARCSLFILDRDAGFLGYAVHADPCRSGARAARPAWSPMPTGGSPVAGGG